MSWIPGSFFPEIKIIEMSAQRFTTVGDWGRENKKNRYFITLAWLYDSRFMALVLIHELIEWAWCMNHGVTAEEADAFDDLWEKELSQGLHTPNEEAGYDRRCPYRGGHVWGGRAERFFAWVLGVNWKEYCKACDQYCLDLNQVLLGRVDYGQ